LTKELKSTDRKLKEFMERTFAAEEDAIEVR